MGDKPQFCQITYQLSVREQPPRKHQVQKPQHRISRHLVLANQFLLKPKEMQLFSFPGRRGLDPRPRMFSTRTFIQGLQQSVRGVPRGQIDVKQRQSLRGAVAKTGESWQPSAIQPRTGRKADKAPKILLGRGGRTTPQLSEEMPRTPVCSYRP